MKSLHLRKTPAQPTLTSWISSAHVGFWLNINLKLPQIGEEALSPSLFPFSLQFQYRGTNISASQKSINNLNFTSWMKSYHWLIISMFLSPWKAGDWGQDFVWLFFFSISHCAEISILFWCSVHNFSLPHIKLCRKKSLWIKDLSCWNQ